MQCSEKCMVVNYGKLILEESLSSKIKKTIREKAAI